MGENHIEWKITCEYTHSDKSYAIRVWERMHDDYGVGQWHELVRCHAYEGISSVHTRKLIGSALRRLLPHI